MKNGPHRGRYVAIKEVVDGFERFFHVFCHDTRDFLNLEAEFESEGDEDCI
jgi:hypothetical protein